MSRKLASIQEIIKIEPIEGADRIELAYVLGWQCVVNKGQFKPADRAVYFEIDSFLPIRDEFEFMRASSYRNHDKNYDPRLFADIQDFMTASVNGQYFVMMHYPMLSWPKRNSGSIQLHGHIHARADYNEGNRAEGIRRYDVGVDANNFYPVSVKQVIDFFQKG